MSGYTGRQKLLLKAADEYTELGYTVGLTRGKVFVEPFQETNLHETSEFDGISIIPAGIVCVDFDTMDMDIGESLPPTLKERSPRGWHLFYQHPDGSGTTKIKWKPNVDLLIKEKPKRISRYINSDGSEDLWAGHVLVSPTPGYIRVWPDETPDRRKLTMAPDWLIKELLK